MTQDTTSTDRYRILFETAEEGVCFIEPLCARSDGTHEYVYVEINPAMRSMLGLGDLRGKPVRENFRSEVSTWYDDFGHVLQTGEPMRV